MIKKILNYYPLIILLGIYLIISLITYKDYGITADEELEYKLGKNLINYYINKEDYYENDTLNSRDHFKYYYHSYPMILSLINSTGYYEWYHLLNMLFAISILIFSYLAIYLEYKNKYLAVLGPLFILITPSFSGHIPANPKDIPFGIMCFISIASIYILSNKTPYTHTILNSKTILKIIFLGLLFGITQSLRIVGYSLYLIYIINIFIQNKNTGNKKEHINCILKNLIVLLGIAIIAHLFMYATYPYIRENIFNVFNLIILSKNFTPWDREILYLGEIINREQRPWHYLFIYIITTTPLFILLTSLLSLKFVKKDKFLQLLFTTLIINIGAYIITKPIIYNGLRHFLYLLPLISITSSIFVIKILQNAKDRMFKIYFFILIIFTLGTILKMYKLHPYEYIYINDFTHYVLKINNTSVENIFETDYWGASYKEATLKLNNYIEKNNIDTPTVYACNVDYAVRYYSNYKFEMVNTRQKANFILCDYQNDKKMNNSKYKIINIVEREEVILNLIRKTELPLTYKNK